MNCLSGVIPSQFEQTEPKGLKDRDYDVNREDDRRRCDKEPRRKIMAADSAPSFRPDNSGLAGRALANSR